MCVPCDSIRKICQNLKVAQAAGKFKQALSLHPVYAVKLKQRALRKLEKGRKLAKGLWEDRGILGRIHDFFPISAGAQKNSVAYRNFMCSMIDAMSCFKLLLGSYDQLKNEALGFSEILYQLCTVLIDLVVHSAHDSSYLLSEVGACAAMVQRVFRSRTGRIPFGGFLAA